MGSEEQVSHGYGDFIGLLPDDNGIERKLGDDDGEEDPEPDGRNLGDWKQQQGDRDVEDDLVCEEDDLTEQEVRESYEVTTQSYRVRHVTRRDYPVGVKRRRCGQEIEEDTLEKKLKVEPESDPVYGYYDDEEEDFDLWSACPFVEESLKLEQFSKHMLPNSGLSLVKERLNDSGPLSVKVIDLDKQWRKLHKAQAELDLFRAEIIRAQTQLVLQALD